ncbi:leucine-rich repeat-containing protein kinase family protein [uncultured Tolumonas sp.]|uniref:leucine-rich repeat-containing protein kinase family protein n=1 Tax=uncultured Tolumonas sp. TaxID=263765 RepID=UPI002A0A9763|nr:leucine-rich repeat-containing protein kinase family protein [uncultured Tolumonas sp.]
MQTIDQLRSGELAGVRRLNLCCGLTQFPSEIFDLADTLEILDLSGNALSELPDDLYRLHKLRIIFCSNNQFIELPEVLGRCAELSMIGFKANKIRCVSAKSLPAKLRWLTLTDNEIEALPQEIGDCHYLQKLMLAGNRLQTLPPTLANCKRLELLRIAANQLHTFPTWLLSLPRLSWVAYSGNPFSAALESGALADSSLDDIHWDSLEIDQLLGEGASGVIHRAKYADEDSTHVAVKLFKGDVTSDGLPQCEMAASVSAGAHPNLINVLGRVTEHPSGANGLVMELIDAEFSNLAGPPSLDSCTRDVYSADACFELPVALRIARSIVSVAQHLHQRGIMHGDLYGHNILHCGEGRTLLGDFGAASFYATDDRTLADALQKLEVRAFGCILEELIERCSVSELTQHVLYQLNALMLACVREENQLRPDFNEIGRQLAAISRAYELKTEHAGAI